MKVEIWEKCLQALEKEIPAHEYKIWVLPLQAKLVSDVNLVLFAPNKFVIDFVKKRFLSNISTIIDKLSDNLVSVELQVGSIKRNPETLPPSHKKIHLTISDPGVNSSSQNAAHKGAFTSVSEKLTSTLKNSTNNTNTSSPVDKRFKKYQSALNKEMSFDTFVEGKCNMLARAASLQIVETISEGSSNNNYNPFLIYGGVGLGKTHLIHALGNIIMSDNPDSKVIYLHSERFVQEMITALQNKTIYQFKNFYRSVDVLLIDDIQFFAGKERTQEEFFHTFNALLECQKQIIMTCDTFPKEVSGLEDRLKSRFGWGLTVSIDLPDTETRVAILLSKAAQANIDLPQDVAFFIAQRIRSNVRELEGALRRVIATARFQGKKISVEFAKLALHDLIALQDKQVSIENIQKIVAEYYKIRVADLHSKRRTRSVARPRQIAMSLAKHLTSHSLPEIGDAFGGRDHTTVLYACRKIDELRAEEVIVEEDYTNLHRQLTS
ncbi:MAG: chromosomal replication initiator protein DnaA [gamma proteobacterium symbiont of Bathyaustriella thionipta]|nr:chromosomal replication initiator protein DnaA [gamma proteobacterium symbiont of Bathyaustriella thionipta]MCU7949385.1 chromosomal replication initiator protein DnaA [gamma proteobacterium symbiont of Bathyaustriella thionipta]MCU7952521.1 chromosomal replication initiator protein DnaA [gamma proteobacterium symbiont of Bathyaustriella thionipta]MCU7955971.1 chromosomal replication initiator protein DnaA [gamma proteobacterium symbiont of Bathyaustriella thionipta]MCU7968432.1 chromosomal 